MSSYQIKSCSSPDESCIINTAGIVGAARTAAAADRTAAADHIAAAAAHTAAAADRTAAAADHIVVTQVEVESKA